MTDLIPYSESLSYSTTGSGIGDVSGYSFVDVSLTDYYGNPIGPQFSQASGHNSASASGFLSPGIYNIGTGANSEAFTGFFGPGSVQYDSSLTYQLALGPEALTTPEPSSLALLTASLGVMGGVAWLKKLRRG